MNTKQQEYIYFKVSLFSLYGLFVMAAILNIVPEFVVIEVVASALGILCSITFFIPAFIIWIKYIKLSFAKNMNFRSLFLLSFFVLAALYLFYIDNVKSKHK